jgi:hypothetical protein
VVKQGFDDMEVTVLYKDEDFEEYGYDIGIVLEPLLLRMIFGIGSPGDGLVDIRNEGRKGNEFGGRNDDTTC